MSSWVRFDNDGVETPGLVVDDSIVVHSGDIFDKPEPTGDAVALATATLLTPCKPTKILGLWNNFHATAEKTGLPIPEHPWYFVMTQNSYAAANTVIHKPACCDGKILFEGELGIVIGKPCKDVAEAVANDYIFGYTCVNDVTALEFLFAEKDFAHWTRAKCFDGFGVFGPVINTESEPATLVVKTFLEGDDQVQERQNYPVSDMIYSPDQIVSRLSHDMTLNPGDIIACGTSVGAGAMKDGWQVRVAIDGVGELVNTFSDQPG